jgi:hypothetical protein
MGLCEEPLGQQLSSFSYAHCVVTQTLSVLSWVPAWAICFGKPGDSSCFKASCGLLPAILYDIQQFLKGDPWLLPVARLTRAVH